MFRFSPLSLEDARQILSWRYPEPYDFYDAASDPEDAALLLSEEYRQGRLFAVHDDEGILRGFLEFHLEAGALEVGLGLRPQDTGRGLGPAFVDAGLTFGRETFRPATFKLYVAAFNQRAIKVYERLGFREVGRQMRHLLGRDWEFIEMRRPA
jgi:ribosomal-protein-alanine N-acetyltransferase